MADSNIPIRDAAGTERQVDTRTVPNGDERQVILVGDGENAGLVNLAQLVTAAVAVSYGSGTANQAGVAPADAAGRLLGYAVRETTAVQGATAMVRFRSGTTVAGTPLGAGVTVGANESVREWFGPAGINVPTAVFLERVSGSTEVTVYWAAP